MRECFLKKNKAVPCFSDLKTQFCAQNTALLLGPQTMSLQLKMFTSLNVNRAQKNTPLFLFLENMLIIMATVIQVAQGSMIIISYLYLIRRVIGLFSHGKFQHLRSQSRFQQ